MGSGIFTSAAYCSYAADNCLSFDEATMRVSGQVYKSHDLDPSLDPKKFTIRDGNIVWGKHGNMEFHIMALYTGNLELCDDEVYE